ncbi:hypothetical protein FBY35_5064 [Streptomyces sp. SLBN-118]|uniref:hypothetical protein n=1 Tax=Streptomyces sp. SLBN-118 TaxID=2768454 RepID=UPI001171795E|nr:hypothetical protein [Streptomyces sp. SLBN-118]TQK43595.1 hypothetical protein FBY35_5064 [Streptomyces sp. SLBN-118]
MVHVRHPRTAAWAAAAVLILVPAAAGCSDDNGGGSKATPTPSATAPPSSTAPAGNGPADPAAAKAEIEKNWTTFFDPKATTDAKVKVLEHGEQLRPLLTAFSADKNAQQSSAKVTAVQFTSPNDATVTYDLLVGGAPALPGSKGTAVYQDQTWKVSVKTLCALVKLSGNASAPGC